MRSKNWNTYMDSLPNSASAKASTWCSTTMPRQSLRRTSPQANGPRPQTSVTLNAVIGSKGTALSSVASGALRILQMLCPRQSPRPSTYATASCTWVRLPGRHRNSQASGVCRQTAIPRTADFALKFTPNPSTDCARDRRAGRVRAGGNSSTESMGLATAAEMSPMDQRRRLAPGGVSSVYPRALCSGQTVFCL